jgi:hypothetical protein
MMTDGVIYDRDGVVTVTNIAKAYALPTFPAAVSCTGPAFLSALLSQHISVDFASFDDFVERADQWLGSKFDELAAQHRDGDAASVFYIIGWHERENRPAAYSADLWTDKSSRIERILANSGTKNVQRGKLTEWKSVCGTPLNSGLVEQCGFKPRRNDDYVPEVDLMHITEIARQEEIEGAHWVGGKVLLTSVDAKGVTQRVVHEWPDRAGAKIVPVPVTDWAAWRAARVKPESWLKRQMAERKARKRAS